MELGITTASLEDSVAALDTVSLLRFTTWVARLALPLIAPASLTVATELVELAEAWASGEPDPAAVKETRRRLVGSPDLSAPGRDLSPSEEREFLASNCVLIAARGCLFAQQGRDQALAESALRSWSLFKAASLDLDHSSAAQAMASWCLGESS